MASPDEHKVHFKTAALASTAFVKPPEPISKKRKRRRSREMKNQVSIELYKNLSEDIRPPHELAAEGNLEDLKALMETFGITIKETNEDGETLLHSAAKTNQVAVMLYLIESGIHLGAVDRDGNTALHVAVENGHIEAMHLLLNNGASDNVLNKSLDAPLHIAVRSNNTNLIAAFLEHPVELVVVGYRKRTPLHIIAEYDHLEACEAFHNSMLLQEALKQQHGFRLCATDEDNLTPTHLAARKGSHRVLDFIMCKCLEHGYPAETVLSFLDEENSTPLHAATDGGHANVVEVLLKNGADSTTLKYDQPPPLHLACSQGKLEILKMMVEHNGKDILHFRDQYGQTPLHRSTQAINSAQVISYLMRHKVEVDSIDNLGRTPLHSAIISGSLPAVKELIVNGANPLLRDQQGYNSLHHAVTRNRKAIVSCLLDLPCAPEMVTSADDKGNCPIHLALKLGFSEQVSALISVMRYQLQNLKDEQGNNYLHLAAASGDWKALSVLLDTPACQTLLNETNKFGATPLHMAAGAGHLRCTEMLLSHGAMVHKCHYGTTPFLYACLNGHTECAKACLDAHPFQKDWTDDKGNSALHLAVQSGNPTVITLALDKGVQVTHNFSQESFLDLTLEKADAKCAMAAINHDRWQECLNLASPLHPSPMIGLIVQMPDVAKAVLDRCHTSSSTDRGHRNYWERYDFNYLRLKPQTDEDDTINEETDEGEGESLLHKDVHAPDSVIKYKGSWYKPIAQPVIPKCSLKRKEAPLAVLRTMVRFKRVRLLTHPVVEAYLKTKWRDYGRWVYLVQFLLFFLQVLFLSVFIVTAPHPPPVLDRIAINENRNTTQTGFSAAANTIRFVTLFFCSLNAILFVLSAISLGRNALNFVQNIYIWINGFAVLSTFIGLIPFRGVHSAIWEAVAIASFFCWFGLILKLQLYDLFGVYVTMFLAITRSVFQVLLVFSFFILAFGLSFFILNGNLTIFSTVGYSIFINFGHMLGEIDWTAFVRESSNDNLAYDTLTFFLVVALAIVMAIVIQNLLIGLAVGDIDTIRRNAIIEKRNLEVGVFSRLDANMPKKILDRFDRHFYKTYPNKQVSVIRRMWRFFWRSIKGDTAASDVQHNTYVSSPVDKQQWELRQIKQRLEELALNQEKLMDVIREMHTMQQRQKDITDAAKIFHD